VIGPHLLPLLPDRSPASSPFFHLFTSRSGHILGIVNLTYLSLRFAVCLPFFFLRGFLPNPISVCLASSRALTFSWYTYPAGLELQDLLYFSWVLVVFIFHLALSRSQKFTSGPAPISIADSGTFDPPARPFYLRNSVTSHGSCDLSSIFAEDLSPLSTRGLPDNRCWRDHHSTGRILGQVWCC
jgi:hypothetical protein